MESKARPGAGLVVVLAAAGCAAWIHLAAAASPFDDAYITFRYVDNLFGARGAVYNAGERVFGISCPLYAAWLAAARAAPGGADLTTIAVRGNAIFLMAAAALVWRLLRRLEYPVFAAAAAAGAVLLSEGILRASLGGMESSLFLALVFGALAALASCRDIAALALASFASLTRPEGLLLVAVILAVIALEPEARRRWRLLPLGLLPLIVWIAAATAYYGSPIPHSIIAKARPLYPLPAGAAFGQVASLAGRWSLDGALVLAVWMAKAVGGKITFGQLMPRLGYQAAGLAITVWALGSWWHRARPRRAARSLALPAFLLATIVFYAATNPLILPWYLPVLQAPWLVAAVAAGLGATSPARWALFLRAAGVSLVLSTAAASFVFAVIPSGRSLLAYGATDARQAAQLAAYARSAAWLARGSAPTDTVAAAEIGVLGYHLDRRILDACGLVSPEALRFLPVPPDQRGAQPGAISADLIRSARPDLVVTLPVFVERSLLRSDWFAATYALAHEEPLLPDDPRYRAVLVFRMREQGASLR